MTWNRDVSRLEATARSDGALSELAQNFRTVSAVQTSMEKRVDAVPQESHRAIAGMERMNVALDVRHPRRALTEAEFGNLLQSAIHSGIRIQGFDGEQRSRIYILSYMTGLRRTEFGSLTPQSFDLNATQPTLTVEATVSKHRRKDILPLHAELVALLRQWIKGLKATDKLFPKLATRKTWLMVQKDLERVGIAYKNTEGIADFHAAGRHTHITELLRRGATLPEAQKLARHSDIRMTMKYTHIGIADQAAALRNISTAALHGRCISGVIPGQTVALSDKRLAPKERRNPCGGKGFGNRSLRLSSSVKVEDSGVEPLEDSAATSDAASTSVKCGACRVARALHLGDADWLQLSSLDIELQSVLLVWERLPEPIRRAISALIDSQKEGRTQR